MKKQTKNTDIPASLKTIDVKSVLRKRGIYLEQKMNARYKEAAKEVAREILKSKKKQEKRRHTQFTNEQINAYWEKQIHMVDVIEGHFENKLKQFIGKIQKDFLSHLESEVESKKSLKKIKVKDFFDESEDDLLVQAQIDFTPLLDSLATLAGQEAMKLTGSDQVYIPFQYKETIKKNVDKFTRSMFETDRDKLISMLDDGIAHGSSIPEIRSAIESEFPEYTKNQATKITRTEVIRVSNQASLDAYEQSGVVEGKQWLTAGAVDECAQYEGQIVTLSDSFYGSDNEFQDGDPPLHPNCRCVILPIVIDK